MIPISEARKDKFLWRMACIERPKRSAVLLCVKKINKRFQIKKTPSTDNFVMEYVPIVKFLIRETRTLAR